MPHDRRDGGFGPWTVRNMIPAAIRAVARGRRRAVGWLRRVASATVIVDREVEVALRRRWADLPEGARTEAQLVGRLHPHENRQLVELLPMRRR